MSLKSEEVDDDDAHDEVCACCGIAEVDDVKLKLCDGGCDLVKYCSIKCQDDHREQHEEECTKRNAELHDKELFTQNDGSFLGECPICCLPLPLHPGKSTFMSCCSKFICDGCAYANTKREIEAGLQPRCAFCREPEHKSPEEVDKRVMKRIKKHNDPVAMAHMGKNHLGEGDYGKAFEYFTKSAELGDVAAHFCLATLYYNGDGVEEDEEKAIYHFEQAAIGGHPAARGCLGTHEKNKGRLDRAAKHFIIAANLGSDTSLQQVKALFMLGIVSKEEYAAALRGYQAAVDEAKSPERERAEEVKRLAAVRGI
jgi:tetratricopeptide (TPR) repeat protein